MNKLKYLFLLILCAGIMGNFNHIFAQNGGEQILVAGKNPLKKSDVKTLIEFYEWAFEAKFNASERENFQAQTVAEFRSNQAQSRQTIDDIAVTLPKILAADEDVQQKTREAFLSEFLPEARKNNDANSQLLLGIYETAHGENQSNLAENNAENAENLSENSNNSNESTGETTESSTEKIGNLSALAGKWVWARTGSSYAIASTGVYAGGNGSRFTYQFSPNGAVEYTGIMNVMTGGCRMQIFRTMKGKASLNGETLTINWSPGKFTRDDSCSRSKNYTKTMPAETEIFQANFKHFYDLKELCLKGKDETCFSPSN